MANMVMAGFRWVKSRFGSNNQPIEERVVVTSNAVGVFTGDCLKLVSDGTVIPAAAGDAIYGICNGVVRYKTAGAVVRGGNYLPITTVYTGAPHTSNPQASVVSCTPCQGQVFEADFDTVAATLTAAQDLMFGNADIVATAGNTVTGRSGHVINGAAGLGTATAQWRLLEISPDPSNDVTAVMWKVRVTLNESTEPGPHNATGT
jgi:hypothetical protein